MLDFVGIDFYLLVNGNGEMRLDFIAHNLIYFWWRDSEGDDVLFYALNFMFEDPHLFLQLFLEFLKNWWTLRAPVQLIFIALLG